MARIVALLVALCLFAALVWAGPPEESFEITWEELAAVLVARRVELTVPEGLNVEGDVLSVGRDRLVLNVRKSSGVGPAWKGRREIARAGIKQVRVLRKSNWISRLFGRLIGRSRVQTVLVLVS